MDEGFTAYPGMDVETTRSQWAIMPFTSRGILRSLMNAMEELELNAHNTSLKSDHAHMYLYLLREQQIEDLVPYTK